MLQGRGDAGLGGNVFLVQGTSYCHMGFRGSVELSRFSQKCI